MKVQSRLHLYSSKNVKERAYIIGEKTSLLALAEALKRAATGNFGSELVTVYADNGHDYDIFITKDISENEWQNLPNDPSKLNSIETYDKIKSELQKEKAPKSPLS
ncbi:hypothetical protein EB118_09980 [bacterium]|nr:hypothetical protein [bacterium]